MKSPLIHFPVSSKVLISLSWIFVIISAFLAGFYHSAFVSSEKKYAKLEDKYVRVRDYLGVSTTQKIIESTYESTP